MLDLSAGRPPGRPSRAPDVLAAAALAGAVALAYANAPAGGFLFDDIFLVRDSPCVRDFPALAEGFLPGTDTACGYRPVRHLSYFLDAAAFGTEPAGFHLSSVLLHLLVVALVLGLSVDLGLPKRAALLAAAFFAVHPVHTEAVTYISGRKDVLAAFFGLLALRWFLRWRRSARARYLALAAAAVFLAVGSKETGVVLPVLAALAAFLLAPDPRAAGGPGGPARVSRAAWVAVLAVGAAALAYAIFRGLVSPKTAQGLWGGSLASHSATAASLQLRSLGLLLWPDRLLGDYSPAAYDIRTWASPDAWAGLACVATIGTLAWIARRRAPVASFLLAGYLVTLAPSAQIAPHHELFGERNLYFPSVFLCIGAGWVLSAALEAARRATGARRRTALLAAWTLAVSVALAAGTLRTAARNADYRSEDSFWSATLRDAPRCARALSNLASVRLEQRRWAEALDLLVRAGRVRAEVPLVPDPTLDAREGVALLHLGRHSEAAAALDRALPALPDDAATLYARAEAARGMGDGATRVAMGRRLAAVRPDSPLGVRHVCAGLVDSGRPAEALAEARAALVRFPNDRRLGAIARDAERGLDLPTRLP